MPPRRDRVARLDSDHGEIDRPADGAEKGRVSTRPNTEAETARHIGKVELGLRQANAPVPKRSNARATSSMDLGLGNQNCSAYRDRGSTPRISSVWSRHSTTRTRQRPTISSSPIGSFLERAISSVLQSERVEYRSQYLFAVAVSTIACAFSPSCRARLIPTSAPSQIVHDVVDNRGEPAWRRSALGTS